jgi:hypothetical protein
MARRSKKPSEFGGVPGLVAPQPHDISSSAYEQARLQRAVDPADSTDSVELALAREWEREGRKTGDAI